MKKQITFFSLMVWCFILNAQTNPVILKWLRNNTGATGKHYVSGNSTPIVDADSCNVQTVLYSTSWAYVRTKGVPAYTTGPYLDGNPSNATNQNAIFKFPLNPVQNTGVATATTGGNIGVFINGVALFDYRDGVSWQNSTSSLKGGPLGGTGDGVWNRDAIVGERIGFDCSKGHPAMGNYHHHQNPSAFNLDRVVISTVCNLYLADGLYTIDSTQHSPLIGFAYDGFPIYGAYAYLNTNGTGGIVRMKSSYTKRSITTRTTYAGSSTAVTTGPAVSTTYPIGYFKEDYQYNATSAATPDYLDDHNGRFCVTPEYPNGIYCYFATVDNNWNSAYPYVVGPTFYGTKVASKVTSITEVTTTLPVKLISFKAYSESNKVVLNWATAMEINNKHFEIERSEDGKNFKQIGIVKGIGNSNRQINYSFIDESNFNNKTFYKLKQIDFDGTFEYSNVISANAVNDLIVNVYPNPSADLIAIQIGNVLTNDIKVYISDLTGKVLQEKEFIKGTSICYFDTTLLYEGNYIITIDDNGHRTNKKITITK